MAGMPSNLLRSSWDVLWQEPSLEVETREQDKPVRLGKTSWELCHLDREGGEIVRGGWWRVADTGASTTSCTDMMCLITAFLSDKHWPDYPVSAVSTQSMTNIVSRLNLSNSVQSHVGNLRGVRKWPSLPNMGGTWGGQWERELHSQHLLLIPSHPHRHTNLRLAFQW